MASLENRIDGAVDVFMKGGLTLLASPASGKQRKVKSNKELTTYIRLEVSKQLANIGYAIGQYVALQKMFARKGKNDTVAFKRGDATSRIVDKSDLVRYKNSIDIALKDVIKSLAALTKRYRRPPDPTLAAVSGANALTFIDDALADYLTGPKRADGTPVPGTVLTDTFASMKAAFVSKGIIGKLKTKTDDLGPAQLLANLNNALTSAAVTDSQTLGAVLQATTAAVGGTLPPYVSRYVLITAPHLIRYYRARVLGQGVSLNKRFPFATTATGTKYVRPYYQVTEEFRPIMNTIEGLRQGATEATAVDEARRSEGKRVPPVITYDGDDWYSLTAVQKFNSPHTAKKSVTGAEMTKTVPATSPPETVAQVNTRILKGDMGTWPAMWASISKDGNTEILGVARSVLAIFKAVYDILRSKPVRV